MVRRAMFTLILMAALGASGLSALTVLHQPQAGFYPGDPVLFQVDVMEGLELVSEVNLCHKPSSGQDYAKRAMDPLVQGSNVYTLELSGDELGSGSFDYYFEFTMSDGQFMNHPQDTEGGLPFSVAAEIRPGSVERGFVLLSTAEDFPQEGEYLLAVSYLTIASELDPKSIKVWVNGKDVTKKTDISGSTIVYKDKSPKTGLQQAYVTASDLKGAERRSELFDTIVSARRGTSGAAFSGNLGFLANVYDLGPQSAPLTPSAGLPRDEYAGTLDLFAKLGGLQLNGNVFYSNLEDRNSQPVNRYRLGMITSGLNIQAGDYAPQISPLVMSNRNNRGLYAKLNSKYLGLDLSFGDMARKTISDAAQPGSLTAFRQQAIGGRLRLGSEQGLSMGFNFSRNRDIIASLDSLDYIQIDSATGDTLLVVSPQDNLVASVDMKIQLPWLRTSLGAEVAGSLYNRNTWPGPISSEEVSQYVEGFDFIDPADLADVFVINRNMEPLLPSIMNCAAHAYLRSMILNNLINASYSVTGPAFTSLSTWNSLKDFKTLSVSDMFHLGRWLFLSGGYTRQEDNFSRTATSTNTSTTWYAQGTLHFNRNIFLKGSYFTTSAFNEDNPEISGSDYIPYESNSDNLSAGAGFYNSGLYYWPQQVELTYRSGNDGKEILGSTGSYDNDSNSLNLTLGSRLKFIPLKLQIVLSLAELNYLREGYAPDPSTNNSMNYQFRASYDLFGGKFRPFLQFRNQSLTGDGAEQTYQYLSYGVEAYPWKNLSVRTDLSHNSYKNAADSSLDNRDLVWRLTLNQRF